MRRLVSYILIARPLQRGFTIVELLIVIVVIAVLAAITIVTYNGIANQARDASLKSDIESAAKVIENDNTTSGSYPDSATTANNGQGLKSSPGNTLSYVTKPYGYCVSASNSTYPNTFALRSNKGQILSGTCDTVTSTVSGSGANGYMDGNAATAQFSSLLNGLAFDSSGTAYLSDNNRIRKITSDGTVSTLAGSGTAGFVNGVGTAAQFGNPRGLAVDKASNVYVADYTNNCIRKITPSGTVTTYAGLCGVQGYVDGPAASARFVYVYDVATDDFGNVYVADFNGSRIRKIDANGYVTTFAGAPTGQTGQSGTTDGNGTAARFSSPQGIATDAAGNIYVADTGNHRVRKITPNGDVTTLAGSTIGEADGTGSAAKFFDPKYITADTKGNVYVVSSNNRIRQISQAGVVTTLAGTTASTGYVDGTGTDVRFGMLGDISVGSLDTLYVSDATNYRIRKVTQ